MHSVSKYRSFVALRLIGEESLLLRDQIKIKQIRIAEKDSKPCSTDTRSEEHHHHSPTRSLHLDQMQGCILHSELPQIDCCFPIQFQLERERIVVSDMKLHLGPAERIATRTFAMKLTQKSEQAEFRRNLTYYFVFEEKQLLKAAQTTNARRNLSRKFVIIQK